MRTNPGDPTAASAGPAAATTASASTLAAPLQPPAVDVVVPMYNEERVVAGTTRRLHRFLSQQFPFSFRITLADNGSTDATWAECLRLTDELPHVRAVHIDGKGRGRALREVWSASDARVVAYMDADLSTDLRALLPLVAPVLSGHSDVAIGSRLSASSRVVRGPKREIISRTYNVLLRTALDAGFSDAQCGFKALSSRAAQLLLPLVDDDEWFFDTELLVMAEHMGLRIHEVPVDWVDDPDSSVDIVATALADLRGMWRLGRALRRGDLPLVPWSALRTGAEATTARPGLVGQAVRFAAVGVASTLAYVVLFVLLRQGLTAQWANASALLLTAIGNTAANRRLTFGVRGRADRLRHQLQGLVVFGVGLAVTAVSLHLLTALDPDASRGIELVVLITAGALATVVRFLMFRGWVFRSWWTARTGRRHPEPVVSGVRSSS